MSASAIASPVSTSRLDRSLSIRARNRLLVAHDLVWNRPGQPCRSFNCQPEVAMERAYKALEYVEAMPQDKRQYLQGLVDFVEDYGIDDAPPMPSQDGEIVILDDVDPEFPLDEDESVEIALASIQELGFMPVQTEANCFAACRP